jgi:tetratricopeptide (TPR) repeat protein
MLKAQKKISMKEIKEDRIVTMYFQAQAWINENKRLAAYIVGAPIAIAVIIFFWIQKRSEWNLEANAKLAKVMTYYDQGKYNEAVNGSPQEGVQGLEAIVEEHGSVPSGEVAKFYLANSYFALGNYSKALSTYDDVSISDKMIKSAALAGEAACYEVKGNYSEAASYFEKAASKGIPDLQAPGNLQRAAVNYAAAGEKEKAVDILQKIKKEFPSSVAARDVDKYIAEFSL